MINEGFEYRTGPVSRRSRPKSHVPWVDARCASIFTTWKNGAFVYESSSSFSKGGKKKIRPYLFPLPVYTKSMRMKISECGKCYVSRV